MDRAAVPRKSNPAKGERRSLAIAKADGMEWPRPCTCVRSLAKCSRSNFGEAHRVCWNAALAIFEAIEDQVREWQGISHYARSEPCSPNIPSMRKAL
jgi:hypothetical protein